MVPARSTAADLDDLAEREKATVGGAAVTAMSELGQGDLVTALA